MSVLAADKVTTAKQLALYGYWHGTIRSGKRDFAAYRKLCGILRACGIEV